MYIYIYNTYTYRDLLRNNHFLSCVDVLQKREPVYSEAF